MSMLNNLITQRRLIWSLAKNDFRKRFAGSYLGIVWALVQPVVTVLVYWFVFQVGLRQTAKIGETEEPRHWWNTAIWSRKWCSGSRFFPW